MLVVVTLLSWKYHEYLSFVHYPWQSNYNPEGSGTEGMWEAVGFVLTPEVRLRVIQFVIDGFLPFLVAFGATFIYGLRTRKNFAHTDKETVTLLLWILAASWVSWFLLFSVDFPRYLAPALILGSPFLAWTLDQALHNARAIVRSPKTKSLNGYLSIVLLVWFSMQGAVSAGLIVTNLYQEPSYNSSLLRLAQYLNTQTPKNSLIETYDSQLFYLLDRPYHYPPDQINVAQIIGGGARNGPKFDYDPFAASPSYIVAGPWSSEAFRLYSIATIGNRASLIKEFGPFKVYQVLN